MTPEEVKAIKAWLKERPSEPHVCTFAGLPEADKNTDEPVYVCVHGKTLKWREARQALGLVQ